MATRPAFEFGGRTIAAGTRELVELQVSKRASPTPINLPVHVLHGAGDGPVMFLSAAIHGDEINGVEVCRRVVRSIDAVTLAGTLLCAPIVNAYGFIARSRYLPDRRDLNRAFPGSATGSLAARIAHLFFNEVVRRSRFGIDLHTAAIHRTNLPQVRSSFSDPNARKLGKAFGTQIMLESPERSGSLRKAAREIGVEVLVYEGGEGLRFDEFAISAGVSGTLGTMRAAGMLPAGNEAPAQSEMARPALFANASRWVRAPEGGVLNDVKRLGAAVVMGETIGRVASPFDDTLTEIRAPCRGVIIGRTTSPVVNLGDALYHIAWGEEHGPMPPARPVAADPVLDEDEIL
ncbi:MAG: succinylglutamate desuccinylase [Hyphomicrobiaceae bacterium]|nr:MAG: succinylglutamate desuccinylase [Hyphomicrobiaceae bacterium]